MSELKIGGTYAALRYDEQTVNMISSWCQQNRVPKSRASIDRMHTTVMYSRKPLPNLKSQFPLVRPLAAVAHGLEIWDTQDPKFGKSRALILTLKSPDICALHDELMGQHGGTYDHAEFIPHVTLSYDIGSMTLQDFGTIPEFTLNPVSLYVEDLL